MNKRKLEEEIFQQNKFEKLNNIADSEEDDDDDDDSVNENNYALQDQDIEGNRYSVFTMFYTLNALKSMRVICCFKSFMD